MLNFNKFVFLKNQCKSVPSVKSVFSLFKIKSVFSLFKIAEMKTYNFRSVYLLF